MSSESGDSVASASTLVVSQNPGICEADSCIQYTYFGQKYCDLHVSHRFQTSTDCVSMENDVCLEELVYKCGFGAASYLHNLFHWFCNVR